MKKQPSIAVRRLSSEALQMGKSSQAVWGKSGGGETVRWRALESEHTLGNRKSFDATSVMRWIRATN